MYFTVGMPSFIAMEKFNSELKQYIIYGFIAALLIKIVYNLQTN
jgi:hypothetical protein